MNKITNYLRTIEKKTNSKDSPHYFPRGAWHNKGTLGNYPEPAELLEQYLPDGGTILEIYAGACDITCNIATLGSNLKWEIHATDIQASKFSTTERSEKLGIKLYDISINDLVKEDFPEKIDILLCKDAFGKNDGHFSTGYDQDVINTNTETEEWMFRNFRYYLSNINVAGTRSMERYKQNLNIYNEGTNNVEILGEDAKFGEFCLVKLNEIE